MTCPKRKYPKARKLMRRSHDFLTKPATVICTTCKQTKLNHVMCPNCGYYRGRQVIDMDAKNKPNAA